MEQFLARRADLEREIGDARRLPAVADSLRLTPLGGSSAVAPQGSGQIICTIRHRPGAVPDHDRPLDLLPVTPIPRGPLHR